MNDVIDFGDPLKHEARLKLWLPIMRELKNMLGRKLKYFTLPGPKAYDVIKWKKEGLLEFDGRGFPEVCFCEMDPNNYINAKRILGNTGGIKGRFENIIQNRRDPRYKAFWELFPYDVYNLDFCGTWFEDEEPLSQTFVSIINLINAHVRCRKFNKFIVFLTIRIDKRRTNKQVIDDLKDNLQDNLSQQIFQGILSIDDLATFIKNRFHAFMLISIPKLLAFKMIPQTRRLSGRITKLTRGYYPRNRYHIGKFVLVIDKERTDLRHNPDWYKQIVRESFELTHIIKIARNTIAEETQRDLQALREEIKRIERYGT